MLVIPGALIIADVEYLNSNVMPLLKQLSYGGTNLADVADGLAVTMLVIGLAIMFLALMGICGAVKKYKTCLCIYAIIVLAMLIVQIVLVILWIVAYDRVENRIQGEMLTNLQSKYTYADITSEEISTAWNYLFMKLKCCGVNAQTSTTNNDFTSTPWKTGGASDNIPIFCCSGIDENSYSAVTFTACTQTMTTAVYANGCYTELKKQLEKYTIYYIAAGITILIIEVRLEIG
ncbi:hypothetical protein FSP39_023850 [Pinctada imbricata]|uniref:Tetraspanin n=1 Tax=Pinctada imbricata TaxID=66713 RepID=A0AA88YMI3_PINIB|nr:hypothetical protein FSP39_023850 [Pinctada imbricata]